MTDEEFERKWQENKDAVLANDEEYQKVKRGYEKTGIVDWIIYIGGIVLGDAVGSLLVVSGIVRGIIDIVAAIVFIIIGLWMKSLFISRNTAEEIEQKVKERYRRTL